MKPLFPNFPQEVNRNLTPPTLQEVNRNLKQWLHTDSHKKFNNLDLEWKQGHNPELHVNGEVFDLNGLDENGIHKLLGERGFEEL